MQWQFSMVCFRPGLPAKLSVVSKITKVGQEIDHRSKLYLYTFDAFWYPLTNLSKYLVSALERYLTLHFCLLLRLFLFLLAFICLFLKVFLWGHDGFKVLYILLICISFSLVFLFFLSVNNFLYLSYLNLSLLMNNN